MSSSGLSVRQFVVQSNLLPVGQSSRTHSLFSSSSDVSSLVAQLVAMTMMMLMTRIELFVFSPCAERMKKKKFYYLYC